MAEGPTLNESRKRRIEDLAVRDFARYAGASGDFNPIHYDRAYSEDVGHPDVFAPGMLTAGIAAGLLTEWFPIASITAFNVRFRDRVWPGDTITTTATIVDVDEDDSSSTYAVALETRNQKDEVVLTGEATAVLD